MLALRQSTVSSMGRDAWVEIDLSALETNVRTVRSWINQGELTGNITSSKIKLMAIVKGDAYGHGAVAASKVFVGSGAEWLGVASVDEACQLRANEIKVPILILSPIPSWAIATAIDQRLDMTISSLTQIKDIAKRLADSQKVARVHIKVDTGMHRIGAHRSAVPAILDELCKQPNIQLAGVFSHLAKAYDEEFAFKQDQLFRQVLKEVDDFCRSKRSEPHLAHIASTEALRQFAFTRHDMVRAGICLYGLEASSVSDVLRPALSVKARLSSLQEVRTGEAVGYNLTWTANRQSRLASIPIGYADGVNRSLSNRIKGLIRGQEVKQVGIISMDQMLIDITDAPDAQEGDIITLIGSEASFSQTKKQEISKAIYLADWAKMLNTITYELACQLRVRLPRVYTRQSIENVSLGEN